MINTFTVFKKRTEVKAVTSGCDFLKKEQINFFFQFNIILTLNVRKKELVRAKTEDKAVAINVFKTGECHSHIFLLNTSSWNYWSPSWALTSDEQRIIGTLEVVISNWHSKASPDVGLGMWGWNPIPAAPHQTITTWKALCSREEFYHTINKAKIL